MNDYQQPRLQQAAAGRAVRAAIGGNEIASESEVQRELRLIGNLIEEISASHHALRERIAVGCVGPSPTGICHTGDAMPADPAHSPLGQQLSEHRRRLSVIRLELRDTTDSVAL